MPFWKVAENWDISSKVVAIVTDNASNIVAAVKITGWTHVPCFAHTLNLVVSEAIKSDENVSDLKKRCKRTVTFFHQSVKATEKLKEVQCQIKLPEHKLIQEVDTRWNSTFYMFERIVEQHQAITTALCLSNRNYLCLSAADVKLLEESLSVLQPFWSCYTGDFCWPICVHFRSNTTGKIASTFDRWKFSSKHHLDRNWVPKCVEDILL